MITRPAAAPSDAPLVLVDATAVPADRGGVGRYVDGLIGSLPGPLLIACQARDVDYYRGLAPEATVLGQRGIERIWRRLLWEQIRLPVLAHRLGADVIHSPHYTLPLITSKRRVVTFHDATFFSDPRVHTIPKRWFFRTWIRLSARLADVVVVPSVATATETARYARMDPNRVEVAYHGVDRSQFRRPTVDELQHVVARYELAETGWIAFLGTIEPRKNLPVLIRAYSSAARHLHADGRPVPELVLIGGSGWDNSVESEMSLVQSPAVVRRLGFVPVEDLAALLGGARMVVYPSLGEGFGLPVLEAMASGAAVLTTNRLALPEVGGEAVAYTEIDAPSISEAVIALLTDDARSAELRILGEQRAATFDWPACARAHRVAYKRAWEWQGR